MEVVLNDVSFSYGDNVVLSDFSCRLKSGKISAIVGKNGSGKSTLLEIIDGLIVPSCGSVRIGKSRVDNKKVGFLFQNAYEQVFNSTVYKEIEFGLNCFNIHDKDKKIHDVINMVGLDDSYLDRNPFKLSNGELHKVALASILVYDPDIIILDEPTVGLDSNSKYELMRLIRSLKKDYNKTVIIVSHDISFLHRFVDYVYLIKDGRVFLEGDKYDVFSNEEAMNQCGLKVPDVLHFSNLVYRKKNIKIGYRDEINDLIKDVYRYVK